MFYSANGKFTKKSIKEGFLDVFQGYVHKHEETELDEIKSDINNLKDKADDLGDEFKSSKRNFYALYDKVSDFDQKFNDLDQVQDEIDQKFSYLDEVQDEMEQQINKMNYFEENVGIGTSPHNDYKLDVNGDVRINGGVVGKGSSNVGVYFPLRHSEFKDHDQILMRNNGDIYMGSGKDREITFFNGNPTERKNEFMNMKNGNVGIGTNTPKAGLQVYNNKGAIISSAIASGERTAVLRLGAPYAEDHDAYCAKITSTNNHSSNYSSDLRFYTHDSEKLGNVPGSNEPVPDAKERMSILSNGNVGIGTSNPVGKLHSRLVKQVGKYKIRHHRSDEGYSSKNIIHQNSYDAKSLYANRENIDFISFVNSNTLYTHNMALHDATNWYELNLRYAHSGGELAKDFLPMETDYTIIAYQKQASAPAIIEGDIFENDKKNISSYDPSHPNYSQLSIQSISKTENGNRMALKIGADHNTKTGYLQTVSPSIHPFNLVLQPQSGNVGIGTTSPTRKLDVNGNVIFRGSDFRLDNENRRNGEGGDHRRALVHDTNDQLTINYNNDYKGGVKIGNNMKVFNDGQVNATKFCAGDICLTSADITKIKNL
jgi:hypothetical protein